MKRLGACLAFCLTTAFALAAADGLEVARERMLQRVARVGELKLAKIVGETHDGYLAVADAARADAATEKLVQDENADRALVYRTIAERVGTDAATVGVQRAQAIREQSAVGLLFRDAAGVWRAKD